MRSASFTLVKSKFWIHHLDHTLDISPTPPPQKKNRHGNWAGRTKRRGAKQPTSNAARNVKTASEKGCKCQRYGHVNTTQTKILCVVLDDAECTCFVCTSWWVANLSRSRAMRRLFFSARIPRLRRNTDLTRDNKFTRVRERLPRVDRLLRVRHTVRYHVGCLA